MKLPPHQDELYQRVDEILVYIWDPIGVSGIPEARDEYQSYVPHVFSLLINRAASGEIANYLLKIAGESMGLSVGQAGRENAQEAEEILRNFKAVIYEKAGIQE